MAERNVHAALHCPRREEIIENGITKAHTILLGEKGVGESWIGNALVSKELKESLIENNGSLRNCYSFHLKFPCGWCGREIAIDSPHTSTHGRAWSSGK